jgi:hypothetical protein
MRRTRTAYHHAIRKAKLDEHKIVRQRTATALLDNRSRDFWRDVKKIRTNRAPSSHTIDGHTDANAIAQLFACKYREQYTSVAYDINELNSIISRTEDKLDGCLFNVDCIINTNDVKFAVTKLKAGKNDVTRSLFSDHFIHAGDDLFTHVSLLLAGLNVRGTIPQSILKSTVTSIPKGHNANLSESSNYRGVALSSMFRKIIDNIILTRYAELLKTNELQFGFKREHSTHMCTMILKESISY